MLSTALSLLLAAAPLAPARPPLADVPADATMVLALSPLERDLGTSLDLMTRLLGPAATTQFLAQAPLPLAAIRAQGFQKTRGFDAQGTIGLFRLEALGVNVGYVGVTDPVKARSEVLGALERSGGRRLKPNGAVSRVQMPDGGVRLLFVDDGTLFLLMPDPEDAQVEKALASVKGRRKQPLAAALAANGLGAPAEGLTLYVKDPLGPDSELRAARLTATFGTEAVSLEGLVGLAGGGWSATSVPAAKLAPFREGEFARAQGSLPPARLAALLPLPAERKETVRRLLTAFDGSIDARLFVDANDPDEPVRVLGALRAGLVKAAVVEPPLTRLLDRAGLSYQRVASPEGALYATAIFNEPLTLSLGVDVFTATAGHDPVGLLQRADAAAPKPQSFCAVPGPGSLALAMDLTGSKAALNRLLRETAPVPLPEDEALPFERGCLIVSPDVHGARLRGTLVLGPEEPEGPRPVPTSAPGAP